ncbi:hypothetical protein PHLCEN_2v13236 [Hermanssonia centrifuga]|uniref:Uncharacterized protein n=1 Tax=Hermanssonia centrifuga TaxID=98765 RepID=A0A2R6NER5_9APHY|nr:hypothetical protein PHLCEN_2v13236 [Hermanssonia centrifuga]
MDVEMLFEMPGGDSFEDITGLFGVAAKGEPASRSKPYAAKPTLFWKIWLLQK